MKTTLSIAILALIGQSSAIQLDRQVTADELMITTVWGMGEYTLLLCSKSPSSPPSPVVIKSTDLKGSAEGAAR